jgi:phage-related protein
MQKREILNETVLRTLYFPSIHGIRGNKTNFNAWKYKSNKHHNNGSSYSYNADHPVTITFKHRCQPITKAVCILNSSPNTSCT